MLMSSFRTFLKRKGGLFKKAHELSVLCSVDVAVIIFGHNKKLYDFSSGDINETIGRFQYVSVIALFARNWLSVLTCKSMEEPMNTKDRTTLMAGGIWMMMTMMIWAPHLSRIPCHRIIIFPRICRLSQIIPT